MRRNLSPNAVALDGEFRHDMVHTRGLRLHAATAGNPADPAIVLLHDAYTCWADFKDVLPLLGNLGLHAIAVDLRGYGMSDKPPMGHDLRHLCGDIAGAIRTLGHDKAHIVGMGTGATLAWTMATGYPDHVASITSCGAIHPIDMRRATFTHPWLFTTLLITSGLFRLPSWLVRNLWRTRGRFIRRDLRSNTTLQFQHSPAYHDNLHLRATALAIANTAAAVIRTVRLPLAIPPVKWATSKVQVPTMMLVDASRQSHSLIRAAHNRCLTQPTIAHIPNTRLRPHLENPEGFTTFVGSFIQGADSPH